MAGQATKYARPRPVSTANRWRWCSGCASAPAVSFAPSPPYPRIIGINFSRASAPCATASLWNDAEPFSITQDRAGAEHLRVMPGLAAGMPDQRVDRLHGPTRDDLRDVSQLEIGLVIGILAGNAGRQLVHRIGADIVRKLRVDDAGAEPVVRTSKQARAGDSA